MRGGFGFDIFLLLTIKSNWFRLRCCLTNLSIEDVSHLGYMCYYHPNLAASMVCLRCGRRICSSCAKPYGELALCPSCFHATAMNQHPIPPPAPVAAPPGAPTLYAQGAPNLPPGGTLYGPYPAMVRRFSWLTVALLSIVSILILANAFALLWPSFFNTWVQFFPWVVNLGPPFSFGFIFGVILSIIIAGATFLYMLGFRVLAALIVFPAAILSLFIGGGFVVGLILGVLTGILMVMYRGR